MTYLKIIFIRGKLCLVLLRAQYERNESLINGSQLFISNYAEFMVRVSSLKATE
jgi:hypothetical protein